MLSKQIKLIQLHEFLVATTTAVMDEVSSSAVKCCVNQNNACKYILEDYIFVLYKEIHLFINIKRCRNFEIKVSEGRINNIIHCKGKILTVVAGNRRPNLYP